MSDKTPTNNLIRIGMLVLAVAIGVLVAEFVQYMIFGRTWRTITLALAIVAVMGMNRRFP